MASLLVDMMGGKKLIEHFDKNNQDLEPFFYYGLNLNHKHIPETMFHNKLTKNYFPFLLQIVFRHDSQFTFT